LVGHSCEPRGSMDGHTPILRKEALCHPAAPTHHPPPSPWGHAGEPGVTSTTTGSAVGTTGSKRAKVYPSSLLSNKTFLPRGVRYVEKSLDKHPLLPWDDPVVRSSPRTRQ
jgi:hypothetical protein